MLTQRTIVDYFVNKLIAGSYAASFGYQSPQFGRGASFCEVWVGNEAMQVYNGRLPVEGILPIEVYAAYFIGNDMPSGEWYDYTEGVLRVAVDSPEDRASDEWFGWDQQTIIIDRHTSLRRFDNAQEDSNGFAVARIDIPVQYLLRGPRP
jgi:hypothetical protein